MVSGPSGACSRRIHHSLEAGFDVGWWMRFAYPPYGFTGLRVGVRVDGFSVPSFGPMDQDLALIRVPFSEH
jgi:hypothetical protein